jgi:hypothetical protein
MDARRRFQVFTRMPALIALVRRLRNHPVDAALQKQAVQLAEELLHLDWTEPASAPSFASVVPTKRKHDEAQVPLSLHYADDDYQDVVGYAMLWACKIMLGGLCQSLHEYGAGLSWPSLPDLYQEEARCASLICMSVDYFSSLVPYGSTPILLPLQVAWGVYWRQRNFQDCIDAQGMMSWIVRRANELLEHMNVMEVHVPGLKFLTERLQGGYDLPNNYFAAEFQKIDGYNLDPALYSQSDGVSVVEVSA